MSVSLIFLSVSLFTWGLGEGLFLVFQPIYLAKLGANTMTIAAVFSAFGLAMMIAHIPAGFLADRIGRKPLLIVSWTLGVVATWVMAFAQVLPVFITGMILYGLTGFVSSPLNSYVTAGRGKLTPARVMTYVSAAYNLGAVIGPLGGGWIGERIGLRSIYFIAAGMFVISTVILLFIRPQTRDHHDPNTPAPSLRTNTRFIGFLGIISLIMFATYLPQPLTARFLENERGLSLGMIGVLSSVNGLGNAIFNLFLGQFSSRLGLVLVQVCVASFSLLIWQGTGQGWYAAGYFMLGGFRTSRSFIFSTVRGLIHPAQMGLAYGVAETFNSMAIALAPLLAGILYTQAPELVYPASLGLMGAAILLTIIFVPRQPAEESTAASPTLEL